MATPDDVQQFIASIAPFFKSRLLSPEERAQWFAGWAEDLRNATPGELQRASASLRNQASPGDPFPTPKMVRAAMAERDRPKAERNPVWRSDIGDAEWSDLSLSDKIRHRALQAMEMRQKAIDCLARVDPTRNRANMPPEGERCLERAAWLEADAKRLKEHMTGAAHIQRAIAA